MKSEKQSGYITSYVFLNSRWQEHQLSDLGQNACGGYINKKYRYITFPARNRNKPIENLKSERSMPNCVIQMMHKSHHREIMHNPVTGWIQPNDNR